MINVDAFIEQHFEDGAALRNEELLARARELDREATLLDLADVLFGREILDVDLRARPVLGGRLERIEHRGGAAAVEVRLLWRSSHDAGDIEHAARVLVVEMEARTGEVLQLVQERHVGARATAVVQRKGTLTFQEPLHHAADRRDPDAARQQDRVAGILLERKVVARRADLDGPADTQLVVHEAGATAARRVALDRESVSVRLRPGHDQRIAAHMAARQMHVHMGAGLIGRERLAVRTAELEDVGVARRVADRGQANLDQGIGRRPGLADCGRRVHDGCVSFSWLFGRLRLAPCLGPRLRAAAYRRHYGWRATRRSAELVNPRRLGYAGPIPAG